MKREYAVTTVVAVYGDEERDFDFAVRELKRDGVHLDRTTAGDRGCFSMRSGAGAVSVLLIDECKTPKRKVKK